MKLGNYINNVSALQVFQVLRFSTLILIGIFLVQSGYHLEEIGRYELFFFVANVISFFWAMGLNNGLMSYFPALSEERKKVFFFNLGLLLIGLGIIASLLLWIFQVPVGLSLGLGDGGIPELKWILVYMLLSGPSNFTEYIYLLSGEPRKILRYGFVIFGLQFGLMMSGIYLHLPVESLLILMVSWAAIKFIWYSNVMLRHSKVQVDLRLQWTFLIFSLPLIFHMLLGNGMEYVDGFLVNHFYDEATFAQFRYGARELPLVTILVGAISTALIPVAVVNMADGLTNVKVRIKKLMDILFPISIILILISPFAFPFFYNDDYSISAKIFNIYLLVISSRILMPQVVLFAKHENNALMLSAFIELIVNVVLSLILLQYFGVLGIAWATVIAYLVNKLILIIVAKRKHGVSIVDYLDFQRYLIWLSILIGCYYISTWYH